MWEFQVWERYEISKWFWEHTARKSEWKRLKKWPFLYSSIPLSIIDMNYVHLFLFLMSYVHLFLSFLYLISIMSIYTFNLVSSSCLWLILRLATFLFQRRNNWYWRWCFVCDCFHRCYWRKWRFWRRGFCFPLDFWNSYRRSSFGS